MLTSLQPGEESDVLKSFSGQHLGAGGMSCASSALQDEWARKGDDHKNHRTASGFIARTRPGLDADNRILQMPSWLTGSAFSSRRASLFRKYFSASYENHGEETMPGNVFLCATQAFAYGHVLSPAPGWHQFSFCSLL